MGGSPIMLDTEGVTQGLKNMSSSSSSDRTFIRKKSSNKFLSWFISSGFKVFGCVSHNMDAHHLLTAFQKRWIETNPILGLSPEYVSGLASSKR
ncbi:hypothetical protein CEXT_82201 [Caerostris extrusa]|uniref:Uncharacterized protein n=1 Tax=Caerostris extrusa TaxID=172846 RepID=A0AAV4QI59_CAEEX|nr:hypothetical protein CEXT_82201 [Caerostris extrusa]